MGARKLLERTDPAGLGVAKVFDIAKSFCFVSHCLLSLITRIQARQWPIALALLREALERRKSNSSRLEWVSFFNIPKVHVVTWCTSFDHSMCGVALLFYTTSSVLHKLQCKTRTCHLWWLDMTRLYYAIAGNSKMLNVYSILLAQVTATMLQ